MVTGCKVWSGKQRGFGDLLHSIVPKANNTVSCTSVLLRRESYVTCSYYTHIIIIIIIGMILLYLSPNSTHLHIKYAVFYMHRSIK